VPRSPRFRFVVLVGILGFFGAFNKLAGMAGYKGISGLRVDRHLAAVIAGLALPPPGGRRDRIVCI